MAEFVEYEAPTSCLRRLTQQDKSGKFKLIVTNDQDKNNIIEILTTINKARIISKKINNLFEIDPTLDEYEIELPKEISISEDIKIIIEKLLKSTEEKVLIEKSKERQANIIRLFLGESTKEDNVHIDMKSIKEAISYLSTEAHSSSIQYLSLHLKEIIEDGEFDKLDEKIVYEILDSYFQNQEKSKENQNQEIFEQLKQKENVDIVMHFLLQVEYEDYTEEMKEYIVNNLSDEIVDNELSQIIILLRKLILNSKSSKAKRITEVEYQNDELDGIISHMKKTIGEDLIEKGELKITSGRPVYAGALENIIKYDKDHIDQCFRNNDGSRLKESEGWIQFDFGNRKINLTSYTIRSSPEGLYHPKTWRVLGSDDGEKWDILDRQTNNSSLNANSIKQRFKCDQSNSYYRFIRYIQDDSWYKNREYCIGFSCIEFFGSITA